MGRTEAPMTNYRYENIAATPYAKRLASERGLSLSLVDSGMDGIIRGADVLNARIQPSNVLQSESAFAEAGSTDRFSSVRMTPLAKRVVEAGRLDASVLSGSGYGGKIFKADLGAASAGKTGLGSATGAPVFGKPTGGNQATEIKMNGMRRTIAKRMAQSSLETAPVTQYVEVDVTALLDMRKAVNENRSGQKRVTLTAFILKAMAIAVREHDRFRMQLNAAEDGFLLHSAVNIGIAVGTNEGLSVPVLRDADRKSVAAISDEVASLSEQARTGGLKPDDYQGGVITLSNMGMYDVFAFTPIINQPEASILGIGAPTPRLMLVKGSLENRQFIMQSLTYDHRIINGTEAADFQHSLKTLLEDPNQLL